MGQVEIVDVDEGLVRVKFMEEKEGLVFFGVKDDIHCDISLSIPKTSDFFRLNKAYKNLPTQQYATNLQVYLKNVTCKNISFIGRLFISYTISKRSVTFFVRNIDPFIYSMFVLYQTNILFTQLFSYIFSTKIW